MFTPATSLQEAAEDHDDEQCTGDVEGGHQGEHAHDRLEARGTDNRGDGAEGADRGQPHDHDEDPEHHSLAVADGLEDRGALRAHLLQCEAHEDGGEERGQDRDVARDDAKEEGYGAVYFGLLVGIVRRQLQAFTRVDQVADHEADSQGRTST